MGDDLARSDRSLNQYPGHAIVQGEPNGEIVRRLQRRLNERGCGPLTVDGDFGAKTKAAVKLFQARFPDTDGQPLKVDGVVGAITWAALFGPGGTVVAPAPAPGLRNAALETARTQIGVMENPPGSNNGPEVAEYLAAVGVPPGNAWCAAFVFWCFEKAAHAMSGANPVPRSGSVLQQWRRATAGAMPHVDGPVATNDPSLIVPGSVFNLSTGGGKGHTGFVEEVRAGKLMTIEGNTNDSGSREGIGVFRRAGRKVASVGLGFVAYENRG